MNLNYRVHFTSNSCLIISISHQRHVSIPFPIIRMTISRQFHVSTFLFHINLIFLTHRLTSLVMSFPVSQIFHFSYRLSLSIFSNFPFFLFREVSSSLLLFSIFVFTSSPVCYIFVIFLVASLIYFRNFRFTLFIYTFFTPIFLLLL